MTDNPNFFDHLLETCIQAVTEQGKTVEECLQRFPDHRQQLEPLLRTALRLKTAQSLQVSPAFRQAAQTRLQNRIAAQVRVPPPPAPIEPAPTLLSRLSAALSQIGRGLRPSAFPVFAVALVLVVVLVSVNGSASALPGQQMYPVKTWIETTRLGLAGSDYTAARLHFQYAGQRLSEAQGLAASRQAKAVREPVVAYQTELAAATSLLRTSAAMTPAQKSYVAGEMIKDIPVQGHTLSGLAATLPTNFQPDFELAYQQMLASYQLALGLVQQAGEVDLPSGFPSIPTLPYQSPTPLPSSTPRPVLLPTSMPTFPVFPTGTETVYVVEMPWPTGCPTSWPTDWPEEWRNCDVHTWPTGLPTGLPTSWPTYWPTQYQTYLPDTWQTLVPTFHSLPSLEPTLEYLPTYISTVIPSIMTSLPPVPGNWPTLVDSLPDWPSDDDPGFPEPPPGFPDPPDHLPSWP